MLVVTSFHFVSFVVQIDGLRMCKLSKEEFLNRTPGCVGDILYEHLQLLQHDAEQQTELDFPNNNGKQDDDSNSQSPSPQHHHHHHHHQQQRQHGEIRYEDLQVLQQDIRPKSEPDHAEFGHRFDNTRLNYSPPVATYDPYGNANAIYAAMAAFRPAYPPPMPGQTFSMYGGEHYQFPQHSAYANPSSLFHTQVSE